jgi:glycosyltransferase involved in cell wall biosynthesis
MRVAFVGGRGFHSNYGGVEHAMREITCRLARTADFDVEVYGQGDGRWFTTKEVAPGLISVSAPALVSRFSGNAILAFMNCLYALLVRRPQVLLLFASGPCLLAIIARIMRVPVIAALRGIDSQRDKWGVLSATALRLGEFSALRIADACTVNSLEMYRHFDGNKRGLIYIPNGATDANAGHDSVLASYGLQSDNYLLFAARLDPAKRLHTLLQAYRQLPSECRLPLVIAGGQCHSPEYQQQLDDLSCEGVQFIGHAGKDVLDPLMRHCAVFILPSIKEGMSNSLLTAMNRARCVLCANIDANADVVKHDPAALFEPDDVDGLAARLKEYCSEPQRRRACGHAMRQIVIRNFNWDTTVEGYHDLILNAAYTSAPIAIT